MYPRTEWVVQNELGNLLDGNSSQKYADYADLESALIVFFTEVMQKRKVYASAFTHIQVELVVRPVHNWLAVF